jgi:hypothetical protein
VSIERNNQPFAAKDRSLGWPTRATLRDAGHLVPSADLHEGRKVSDHVSSAISVTPEATQQRPYDNSIRRQPPPHTIAHSGRLWGTKHSSPTRLSTIGTDLQ